MVMEILKKGGGLALFLLLVSACGELGGSGQCGGGSENGSCIRIDSIQPTVLEKNTSSVDILQVICDPDSTATSTDLEDFESHAAELSISYLPVPPLTVTDIPLYVTLNKFSVSYAVGRCQPAGTNCPPLAPLPLNSLLGETFSIPAGGTAKHTLPFFPLDSKIEYAGTAGVNFFAFPHYIATYKLTGEDTYGNPVSVQGSAEFEIGNFDNCSA